MDTECFCFNMQILSHNKTENANTRGRNLSLNLAMRLSIYSIGRSEKMNPPRSVENKEL